MLEPKENREFSCMDDFDNDGWNNSTIERQERIPCDDEQVEGDDEEENPRTFIVDNKFGAINTTNT